MTNDNNGRLCDVFEMFVNRIDTLEDIMTSMRNELSSVRGALDEQRASTRHDDSLKKIRQRFSGVAHCGVPVQLVVNDPFDVDGEWKTGLFNHNVIVIVETTDNSYLDSIHNDMESDLWEGYSPWKFDDTLKEVWGADKYARVHREVTEWYETRSADEHEPLCKDVGLVSDHKLVTTELYEVALKARVPGLLSIGDMGIALSSCNLKTAVQTMKQVFDELGAKIDSCGVWTLYCIPCHFRVLAMALLRNNNDVFRQAWDELPEFMQSLLREGVHPFFSSQRMGSMTPL